MSKNALLEAPITSDHTPAGSYHSPMDGNGQLRQAPAPHQWHQPHPPAPAPTQNRRWIPAAIISAGIVIAGGLVGGAVIMSNGKNAPNTTSAAGVAAADSSTCQAWKTTRAALDQIPPLPAGWDWNTPNIDILVANKNAATSAVLQQFTPEIATAPAELAGAANSYVAAKRREVMTLADRTRLTSAEAAAGNDSLARLNRLCGMAN